MFSLEALTLTFICYVNLCVFFLLVHDVSLTEKQLICVRSRVLNLFGVYLVNFSLLVVFIFIYFLNACLCFVIDLSILEEYLWNMEVLVSFSPLAPRVYWPSLCQASFGTICAQEYGTICAQEYGTICAEEYGTICAQEYGTICAQEYGTICAQEYGTICAHEHGTICAQEYGTICAQEYGTICAQEYGTICTHEHGTICAQLS